MRKRNKKKEGDSNEGKGRKNNGSSKRQFTDYKRLQELSMPRKYDEPRVKPGDQFNFDYEDTLSGGNQTKAYPLTKKDLHN